MALIKMRVLYDSKKKGMAQFAKVIADKYELSVNATSGKFPPEYPCDKERIVVLGLSAKGELSDDVRRFCSELNKTRASNVALLIDGDQATADKVAEIIKNAAIASWMVRSAPIPCCHPEIRHYVLNFPNKIVHSYKDFLFHKRSFFFLHFML